jgi:hypothetical protein|nr:MAG TPA: hypothetical protein [Bacteriophage sp.]
MEYRDNETVAFVNKIQDMTRKGDDIKIAVIDGRQYYDSERHHLVRICDLSPDQVSVSTLSGFAQIIREERKRYPVKLFVVVDSPTRVYATTTLLDDMDRDVPYEAKTEPPRFQYGNYYELEDFLISLRSRFVQSEDVNYLAQAVMSITNTKSIKTEDDGITQKAEARKGIALTGNAEIRPIVKVAPFRTFTEVKQPESEFLFRVKDMNGEVGAALFEADGGAWKKAAMENIKEYLAEALKGIDSVTVIA